MSNVPSVVPVPSEDLLNNPIFKKEHNALVRKLNNELAKVQKSATSIGFLLHTVYTTGSYKLELDNYAEWCYEKFGIGKSSAYNFLEVVERFGIRNMNGEIIHGEGEGIRPEFASWTFSKLQLVKGLPDDVIQNELVASDSYRRITEYVKSYAKALTSSTSPDEPKSIDSVASASDAEVVEDAEAVDVGMNPPADSPTVINVTDFSTVTDLVDFIRSDEGARHLYELFAKVRDKYDGSNIQIFIGASIN